MCKRLRRLCSLFALTALAACATYVEQQDAAWIRLRVAKVTCHGVPGADSFMGAYSFQDGELSVPPLDPDLVDLVYYFDGDDCQNGVIIGHDDRMGFLYPIGPKTWPELLSLDPPDASTQSVAAISQDELRQPLYAFWLKTAGGDFIQVRLTEVIDRSLANLHDGITAQLKFEWLRR